jgi:hypothetical protein
MFEIKIFAEFDYLLKYICANYIDFQSLIEVMKIFFLLHIGSIVDYYMKN